MQERFTARGFLAWMPRVCIVLVLLLALLPASARGQGGNAMSVTNLFFAEGKSSDLPDYDLANVNYSDTCFHNNAGGQMIVAADGTLSGDCATGSDADKFTGTIKGKVDVKSRQVTFNLTSTHEWNWPMRITDGNDNDKEIGWFTEVGKVQMIYQGSGSLTSDQQAGGTVNISYSCSVTYTDIKGNVPYGPGHQCAGSSAKSDEKVGTDTGKGTITATFGMQLEAAPSSRVVILSVSSPTPKLLDAQVIHQDGTEIDAAPGMTLLETDRVRTGYKNTMEIDWEEHATVHVPEMTEFKIGVFRLGNVNEMQMWLVIGGIQASVHRLAAGRTLFSVKTPTVTASVRGTQFSVFYDEAKHVTTVSVTEDEVSIEPVNPVLSPFVLQAGQEVQVGMDRVSAITAPTVSATAVPPSGSSNVSSPSNNFALPALVLGGALFALLGVLLVAGLVIVTRPRPCPAQPRPTDLPESGAPSPRRKPTDLPR